MHEVASGFTNMPVWSVYALAFLCILLVGWAAASAPSGEE